MQIKILYNKMSKTSYKSCYKTQSWNSLQFLTICHASNSLQAVIFLSNYKLRISIYLLWISILVNQQLHIYKLGTKWLDYIHTRFTLHACKIHSKFLKTITNHIKDTRIIIIIITICRLKSFSRTSYLKQNKHKCVICTWLICPVVSLIIS